MPTPCLLCIATRRARPTRECRPAPCGISETTGIVRTCDSRQHRGTWPRSTCEGQELRCLERRQGRRDGEHRRALEKRLARGRARQPLGPRRDARPRVRQQNQRSAPLAHEPVDAVAIRDRQPIESTDDDGGNSSQRRSIERHGVAAGDADAARRVVNAADDEPLVRLDRAAHERGNPRRSRLVEHHALRRRLPRQAHRLSLRLTAGSASDTRTRRCHGGRSSGMASSLRTARRLPAVHVCDTRATSTSGWPIGPAATATTDVAAVAAWASSVTSS